ncbi:MAG: two-component sensor histidine kinase [Marmoricola sp.]|nr:two-component sensor histidine kinase [Marmoricola sp.]
MGRVVARRRAAKARRESQVSREEWTRLRRETIGSIDHELRTPLTSVIGYTELVLAGDAGPLTEEQTWMLERVAGNAGTLLGLLEELLTAAGECVTDARAVDVVELVDQVIGDPEAAPRTPPPAYALRGHNTGS